MAPSLPRLAQRDLRAVRVARALGDPARFRLLREVAARAEVSCAQLTERVALAQATVSHHLRVLADAGLVAVRKSGSFHYYRGVPAALAEHQATLAAAFSPTRSPRHPAADTEKHLAAPSQRSPR